MSSTAEPAIVCVALLTISLRRWEVRPEPPTRIPTDGLWASLRSLCRGVWVGGEERYIHFNGMAMGQGASMALPIYGLYISKVYADPALPYNQDVKFEFPADLDLCFKEYYGEYTEEPDSAEESIQGVFD